MTARKTILASPELEKADILALKSLSTGTANEDQQKRALEVILRKICQISDEPYRDNDRDTIFALGKARVAREIMTIINTNLGTKKP